MKNESGKKGSVSISQQWESSTKFSSSSLDKLAQISSLSSLSFHKNTYSLPEVKIILSFRILKLTA